MKCFSEAYAVACLGVTALEWQRLGEAALEELSFEVARKAFQRSENILFLSLIDHLQVLLCFFIFKLDESCLLRAVNCSNFLLKSIEKKLSWPCRHVVLSGDQWPRHEPTRHMFQNLISLLCTMLTHFIIFFILCISPFFRGSPVWSVNILLGRPLAESSTK